MPICDLALNHSCLQLWSQGDFSFEWEADFKSRRAYSQEFRVSTVVKPEDTPQDIAKRLISEMSILIKQTIPNDVSKLYLVRVTRRPRRMGAIETQPFFTNGQTVKRFQRLFGCPLRAWMEGMSVFRLGDGEPVEKTVAYLQVVAYFDKGTLKFIRKRSVERFGIPQLRIAEGRGPALTFPA